MRIRKGDYGYLSVRRKQTLLVVILMMAAAFGLYFGALHHFGTNQNWFTVFAVLICLPTARFIVNLVMLMKAKGCSKEAYEQIQQIDMPAGHAAFDLYMTSEKKNFDLSHLFFGNRCVIALTEIPSCDLAAGEQHIRRILQQNGFHGYTIKIFNRTKSYCERLRQLSLQTRQGNDDRQQELYSLLLNISL